MSLFRSFSNAPEPKPPTGDEMAADLAMEQIELILNRREEAKQRERDCEPSLMTTVEDKEAYETLEALLKGRHRAVVLPLVLEAFPEMITPAKLADELPQGEP